MDECIVANVREKRAAEGEFGIGSEESVLIEAHFTKRVCLYGAYTVYVMAVLSEQQQRYMRIFLERCPHQRDAELHEYVNSSQDTMFVQMFVMSRPGELESIFIDLDDFVDTVSASLEDTAEGSQWGEWRARVQNCKDVPEFVMTAVMQLDHTFITRAFPYLAQNLWRVGTALANGVRPHQSVLRAMHLFARRVDVGEWYKHANIAIQRVSPGSLRTSPAGASPMSPSLRIDVPNSASMSLMVQVLAYDRVDGTGRLQKHCPSEFAAAPQAFSAACTEIRQNTLHPPLPADLVEATKGVVNEYKFVGPVLSNMERYRKLYTVACPYAQIDRDEAIAMIFDIDAEQARAHSPFEHDLEFLVLSGRVLGAEFEMTYQNTNEDGFGGLVAFLDFLGVDARSHDNSHRFRWYQLETGLLVQLPRPIVEAFDSGAALFATYMFPAPAHVGHPLYRYGALARMLVYGTPGEITWAVRTLHYLASGNPDTTMAEIGLFDNPDEVKYIRGDIPRVMAMLVAGLAGTDSFLDALATFDAARLNALIGVFLSLVLSGRFGKVLTKDKMEAFLMDVVQLEVAHRAARRLPADDSINVRVKMFREYIVSRPVEEWYILCVAFLIQDAQDEHMQWTAVLDLLRMFDLVTSVSERCRVFEKSYADVHASIEYHSRHEHWQCTQTAATDPPGVLDVLYGMCMAAESLNMGIPLAHMRDFHRFNLGANLSFSVAGVRFPIFRTYNSMDARVLEREAFVIGRIGDLLDPVVQRKDVLQYYNRDDGGAEDMRLHPSVFYACTPWVVSDMLANRNKRLPRDSPLTSPSRHLSPFDIEINSLAMTASPRPFRLKRKSRD